MSDEARQEIAQGAGTAEPRVEEGAGLGQILAGLAGLGVAITGGAFLIGWRYTTAFYERLGVPTRALDLQPADYLTAKIEIWYALAAAVLAAAAVATYARRVLPALRPVRATVLGRLAVEWEPRPRATWVVSVAAGVLNLVWGALGLALTDNQFFLYFFATGAAFVTMGVWGIMRDSPRWGTLSGAAALVLASLILLPSLPAVATDLGQKDAEAILRGSEEGSSARLVAASPLGLPGEHCEAGTCVTESVRVVAATSSSYFVVVQGTQTVYCLPAAGLLRMEYTPDKGR